MEILDLLRIEQVPVYCNMLWPDEQQARAAARGVLALGYCVTCAHLFNTAFDPHLTEYTPAYDNSLHYSALFNRYAAQLASRLIDRYELRGKRIVEIGCGKGDFLHLLCAHEDNRGFGFDRSFEPERVEKTSRGNVEFFQDFYSEEYAQRCQPNFVCFRHVLEHVQHPLDFLGALRHSLGERQDVVLYCEVPNALFTLKDMGIWDLIYEHCAYFSLYSLSTVFKRAGFDIVASDDSFGGQFIWVEARPGSKNSKVTLAAEQTPSRIRQYVDVFADQYRANVQAWRERLASMAREGRRVVIWGAGSKGVTFLNMLNDYASNIRYIVDLNPRKQGCYVAGTGQRVVPPGFLRNYPATDVIVMNPLYFDEIRSSVRAMGLDTQVACV
ncbi:MAG: class I SAM-dependent methyltransferase [Candidatus Contendobacter sp.]|nr:class I SAM-dependent methyltransferase [Candidatus Contendobacter sp.]